MSTPLEVIIIKGMSEPIVKQIYRILLKTKKTVAVAESCTGGLVSSLLTELSGSSGYFILGIVAYSNTVKINTLRIPQAVIAGNGAVSSKVARLMAIQAKKLAQTDFGLGITGIAGPTGATSANPIGTVFIAVASKNKTICKKYNFAGNRATIRKKAAVKSLELLFADIYRY